MNTASSLYRELTPEQLTAIVEAHFGAGRPYAARLLEGGLFNTTYRVSLRGPEREVVLRMGPVHCELLLPYEENLMRAEEYVYGLFHANGIPGSTVVACDTSRELIDRDYMIVDFIESVPLSSVEDPKVTAELFRQTGEYAARLNQIEGPGFGRVSEILRGNISPSWPAYLACELSQTLELLGKHDLLTPTQCRLISGAFTKNLDVLAGVTVPHLAHCDLWAGNVLAAPDANGRCEVKAIIDPDRAVFGDQEFDFASPWMITDDFVAGYSKYAPVDFAALESPEKQRKFSLYRLLFHLNDGYVWQVQYNNPENSANCLGQALELAGALTER